MTTITEYLTSIVDTLSVTGVTKSFTHAPAKIDSAQLPASFPLGFRRTQTPMTFRSYGGFPTTELDFFIAIEAVGLSSQPTNYELVETLADNLDAAICAAAPNAISKAPLNWTIAGGNQIVEIGGVKFWAVMATITGKG